MQTHVRRCAAPVAFLLIPFVLLAWLQGCATRQEEPAPPVSPPSPKAAEATPPAPQDGRPDYTPISVVPPPPQPLAQTGYAVAKFPYTATFEVKVADTGSCTFADIKPDVRLVTGLGGNVHSLISISPTRPPWIEAPVAVAKDDAQGTVSVKINDPGGQSGKYYYVILVLDATPKPAAGYGFLVVHKP